MAAHMRLNYLLIMIILESSIFCPLYAAPAKIQPLSLLEHITQKIYTLKKKLFTETQKKEILKTDLKNYGFNIGELSKKIILTQTQLDQKLRDLKKINQEQQRNEDKLALQKSILKKQFTQHTR